MNGLFDSKIMILPNFFISFNTIPCDFSYLREMFDERDYITIEPGKRSGQPCIRGLRITVYDVLSYLTAGMTAEEIIHDFPELTHEDIKAAWAYSKEKK